MSSEPKKKLMTEEEFLAWERLQEVKHEYYAGEIVAMTGASLAHNRISVNLISSLHGKLRGGSCQVLASDMRVWVPRAHSYVYPDVLVVCGSAELYDHQKDVLLNPRLVIEILSPSTERLDRRKKFWGYQTIEALQEYLLVSQDEMFVEQFVRDGAAWRYVAWLPESGRVELKSVPAVLAFDEVYQGVTLSGEA